MKFLKNFFRKTEKSLYLKQMLEIDLKEYYLFTTLSAIIATLGLIINSAAVIIGSMVIAPITIPVMSASIGIVKSDMSLIYRSLRELFKGIAVVYLISFFMVKLMPHVPVTAEIMARIKPTLYDLIIGMAAGAAGAFAMSKRSWLTSIAGVAIAVSVLPPLAASGIGLALNRFDIAYGAFILGASNLAGIHLAGIVVFYLEGFGKIKGSPSKGFYWKAAVSVIIVLILAVPLSFIMYQTINHSILNEKITRIASEAVPALDPEARLADIKWTQNKKDINVELSVYSPEEPGADYMDKLRKTLEDETGRNVSVAVRVLWVSHHKKSGTSSEILERRRPAKEKP
ncbi:MAG: TIGR00341 family protein [Armatimonadota bacterium]